jgi:polyphosphate kinase
MPRNLNRRVEVIFPVEDSTHIRYIRDQLFKVYLEDTIKARLMQSDGSYLQAEPGPNEEPVNSQEALLASRSN